MKIQKRISSLGYEQQYNPSKKKWIPTHVLVANQKPLEKAEALRRIRKNPKLGRFLVVHHKDFDKLNNSPDNLEWLGWHEHKSYHSVVAKKLWKNTKFRTTMLKETPCDICGQVCVGPGPFVRHKKIHTPVMLPCDVCGTSCNGLQGVAQHKRQKHSPVMFSCDICGQVCNGLLSLGSHKRNKHAPVMISCKICGQKCKGPIGLASHKQLHEPVGVSCKICGVVFKSLAGLVSHKRTRKEGFHELNSVSN